MRNSMGMHNVLDAMRCLQLNWAGRVRRMEPDRLLRQLLSSWVLDRRPSNYNQSYSRTLLKALLRSIGVKEADFPSLAANQTEWNHHYRQTAEMRNDLRRANDYDDEMTLAVLDERGLEHAAATFRRVEFSLCGCVFVPDPDPMALPARTEGIRSLSIDNCFDPGLDREPFFIWQS
jgi:hypothetical protein